jgi:MoaA/NifB/PqqE/SkfB family radical SAM enzyme
MGRGAGSSRALLEWRRTIAERRRQTQLPRLPLKGSIDLTYRCDNHCRHCWLWLAENAPEKHDELAAEEWSEVVDQARALGTREWAISGGEPMLRPDFAEIFEYVTAKATTYSLNTNGTLITPQIAQLLRHKGSKMIAVYGATAEVHDHVTRAPGSFDALMEGFARLKEAGAGFTVQLIPMRDNYHQWAAMEELAKSLSKHWRVGAPWLYMSACGGEARNAEIAAQRLDPTDAVALDEPDLSGGEPEATLAPPVRDTHGGAAGEAGAGAGDERLFARCIAGRRDFHVDPYGGMSWCCFVKDPELRYDLRAGASVAERAGGGAADESRAARSGSGIARGAVAAAWEEFIPSLADKVRGGAEYFEGCAACELRADCRWCDVYGYLEHGRHGAKVEYLCEVARENRACKARHAREHRRYYAIGGMTVRVDADLRIDAHTFAETFEQFETDAPAPGAGGPESGAGGSNGDVLTIRHHFELPDLEGKDLGELVYRKAPWAIYRKGSSWIYLGISPQDDDPSIHRVAVFNDDHTRLRVYNDETRTRSWRDGGIASLTMFPTDQIMLSRVLADRGGCFLHSGGVVLNGRGFLFVGHSEAGKSTTMKLLEGRGEVLCDDRNIVRREPGGGFRVYGTWSHGEVPIVSSANASLAAILFLRQSRENRIDPLTDRGAARRELLGTIIKPFVTADWWHKSLDTIEHIANEVPCYEMRFDKSGAIVPVIEALAAQ